jgi:predicted ATPase
MAVGAQLLDQLDQLQADGRVVVLAVDDLHWSDRPSSRAILFALRRLRAEKVLAIVSTRIHGLADPGWARFVAGDSRVTRLGLGGLSAGDLTELARLLGLGVLSDRGASRLVDHTAGNALYCRALLNEIGVAGLSAAGSDGLRAPRELSAVILGRVGTLPPATQTFLAAASVLGQHAPLALVMAVAELDEPQDGAIAAGLLIEGPSAAELIFVHTLYRESI